MAETQLTGLQKRASRYIDKMIHYQIAPGDRIEGHFIGFDEHNTDRAVIQLSNAADRKTLPLMTVVNYFEGTDEEEEL